MKISFHSYANKTNFHVKSFATLHRFPINSEMALTMKRFGDIVALSVLNNDKVCAVFRKTFVSYTFLRSQNRIKKREFEAVFKLVETCSCSFSEVKFSPALSININTSKTQRHVNKLIWLKTARRKEQHVLIYLVI